MSIARMFAVAAVAMMTLSGAALADSKGDAMKAEMAKDAAMKAEMAKDAMAKDAAMTKEEMMAKEAAMKKDEMAKKDHAMKDKMAKDAMKK